MAKGAIIQDAMMQPLAGGSTRFCVHRGPSDDFSRGIVVHASAFAEEMNKSRRMVAWCGRELAASGYHVYQTDVKGSGDSPGDFGDATWDAWIDDVCATVALARARHSGPLWIWGLRAGALMATAALARVLEASLIVWNPVTSGRQHLAQFLRLASTASLVDGDVRGASSRALREDLACGRSVEVAGYCLSPALASGLEEARLVLPQGFGGRVVWIEIEGASAEGANAAYRDGVERLRHAGADVAFQAVAGPRFWQTTEIEDCPAAIEATLEALNSHDDAKLQRATAVL